MNHLVSEDGVDAAAMHCGEPSQTIELVVSHFHLQWQHTAELGSVGKTEVGSAGWQGGDRPNGSGGGVWQGRRKGVTVAVGVAGWRVEAERAA